MTVRTSVGFHIKETTYLLTYLLTLCAVDSGNLALLTLLDLVTVIDRVDHVMLLRSARANSDTWVAATSLC